MNVVESIKTPKPPCIASKTNYLEQNNVVNDHFSVKDSYLKLSNAHILQESMLFKNVWSWDGLEGLDFIYGKLALECCPRMS